MTLIHATLNSLSTHWLEKMARTYVIFHLAVLFSACVALLVVCDNKHSTREVWTEVVPDSGWHPTGFSFLLGFLSASWTMTGFDSTAHIAEEIREPERKAPWAITIAATLAYIFGWLFTIVLAYCAGNVSEILDSAVEQPVAQIFYNVLGPAGGVAFTVFAFIILSCTGMTGMQAGARTFWALSRDELLPGSRFWYYVNRKTHTPVRCVWLIGTLCVLINLIGLGSYTAIAAIFNVTAIALDWSFCIPVVLNMIQRRRFQPGPYYLGKAGWYINAWAVAWTTFVTVIFVLPTELPVSPESVSLATRTRSA